MQYFTLEDVASGQVMIKPSYYIFMQYTGLKDKNGKEIYEGDLLEADWPNPSKVEFVNGKYMKSFFDYANDRFVPEIIVTDQDEVIGNIYENPELLK